MKKVKLKVVVLSVVMAIMLGTVGVLASGQVSENITIVKNNIKLAVDGKPVEFGKDSSGKQIEPLIYNGTTYLPVRAVGDAIGKQVDWDGKTQTVYLGKVEGKVSYLPEVLAPYHNENVHVYDMNKVDKLDIAGKKYSTGYYVKTSDSVLQFNLDSKYKNLKFDLGPSTHYNLKEKS